jgi:Tol biopolymer transport system component
MRRVALSAVLSAFALLVAASGSTATTVAPAEGGYIAFVHQPGDCYGFGEIWLVRPDGSDAHLFIRGTLNYGPRWSPDGKTLVYDREPSIYATDETGQSGRVLFTGRCGVNTVHWSRSGRLAISACGDVYLKGAAGARRLTRTKDNTLVGWTRDGKRLIVLRGRPVGTYTVGLTGGAPTRATFPGFPLDALPRWSPDGKQAAFVPPSGGLYVSNADGSKRRRLASGPAKTFGGASWSPDGKQIVFTRVSPDLMAAQLWIINTDGTGLRAIPLSGLNFDPSWQGGSEA